MKHPILSAAGLRQTYRRIEIHPDKSMNSLSGPKRNFGVLGCSVALNLLLLALILGLIWKHPGAPPQSPIVTARTSAAQPLPEAGFKELGEFATNQLPFRWGQLESEDFPTYIANLRAVRCPQRIIHDLVFHDLERLYRTKRTALPHPDLFWKPGRVRELAREEQAARFRALEREKRKVMRDLLGVAWSQEAWEFWYDQGFADIAELLIGFLSNEQILEAVTAYHDLEEDSSRLQDECELCSEASEKARQVAAYQRVSEVFAAIMSPADFEEMALRICLMEENFEDFSRAEFRFRSGAEARALAKVFNRATPYFSRKFLPHQEEDPATQRQIHAELKALLGEERFAVWQRSQNAGYQEIWQFGREKQLPPNTILTAWQVRQEAELEFSQVSERTDLSPDERAAIWGEIRQQTETALASLLGSAAGAEYLSQHGNWLKGAPTQSGGGEHP